MRSYENISQTLTEKKLINKKLENSVFKYKASLYRSNILKGMSMQSFQIFEASNLMRPQTHRCFLKRAFIRTLLKFDVQIFLYTLL